jgi:hypothetical protein
MDEDCEPVIAPRTVWMAVMEVATRTDTSLAEKIGGVYIQVADFETQPFLVMRTKIMLAVQSGLETETAEKLTSGEKSADTDIEIELTAAECVYLDMAIRVSDFKGALILKKNMWRAIAAILERKP